MAASKTRTSSTSRAGCPDILAAERQVRRLRRRCATEHLIYARLQPAPGNTDHEWKRRMAALIKSNPRQATESGPQTLFQAAAYPEAIAAAALACTSRPKPAQSNLRGQKVRRSATRTRQSGHRNRH
jgi:hypothetical protein